VCAALAPESAWPLHHRGLAYLEQDRLDHAQREFEAALHRDPSLVAALLGRGMVHYRQNRHAEARATLRRVLELEPQHEQARQLLAQLNQRP
jgi:Tfp pilus assembly protein PilF